LPLRQLSASPVLASLFPCCRGCCCYPWPWSVLYKAQRSGAGVARFGCCGPPITLIGRSVVWKCDRSGRCDQPGCRALVQRALLPP
jgi:hypothetical protein